jgi:hypothetical protein
VVNLVLFRDDGIGHTEWIDRHVEDLNKPYGLAWQVDHVLLTDHHRAIFLIRVPGHLDGQAISLFPLGNLSLTTSITAKARLVAFVNEHMLDRDFLRAPRCRFRVSSKRGE